MSSFFRQTAQERIANHIDRFPLLKLDQVLDWKPIEDHLSRQKVRYVRDQRGRPGYPLLSMFKAILLGQWHNLSDPELERGILTRLDFDLFCNFDDCEIPDHSTLNRYRHWLAQNDILPGLLTLINRQLADKGLKVEHAQAAVIDATIIETAGAKRKKSIEPDADGQMHDSPPSKDTDARWIKKDGRFHLGYKQHTRTDSEGYIEQIEITPANVHDTCCLEMLLDGVAAGTTVYADKGYCSQANREHLQGRQLNDGIMQTARRHRPLSAAEKTRNHFLSKTRYVIEQSFGTLKRKFQYRKAAYFGQMKVKAQSYLKAICLNSLKAMNKICLIAPVVYL